MHVLFVCTGNICRSPFAERLMRHWLAPLGGTLTLSSAGTHAVQGAAMSAGSARLLRELGADEAEFTSRQLTPQLLASVDLVLAMALEHRRKVVDMSPSHLRRAFTLRELAHLAGQLPADAWPSSAADRWYNIAQLAAAARSLGDPLSPAAYDVIDPYGQGEEAYVHMAHQVVPAVETLVDVTLRRMH
ncbi:low molecular weight phosphatase family protein [Streptomyces pathocidini]|uniref:arsenate reductase/protein-tyrosine-phosphatase family protein n=1 Tax=Streptomyces pathocidini TaxID=1650571 RepID=UPI0033CD5505